MGEMEGRKAGSLPWSLLVSSSRLRGSGSGILVSEEDEVGLVVGLVVGEIRGEVWRFSGTLADV